MPNEIIIAQFASRILQNPEMPHLETESAKQIPTSSFANTRHLYSQTRTWTPRFSLMRDMDTNGGGEEGIVEKQEMPRKVSLQIIVLSSNRYTRRVSLSLSLEIFFLRDYHGNPFPDTCHISPPVKIHFPEHDTFEDAARAAHYPLPALHPPLSFSLPMLSIRFEIVKFHRFTNYRSRSPLLHSKVVSVSIRISLIFFLRSSFVGGNVFRKLGSRG